MVRVAFAHLYIQSKRLKKICQIEKSLDIYRGNMPQEFPIKLSKTKKLQAPDETSLKLYVKFITFAAKKLGIEGKPLIVRFLHACPDEPVTTAAYEPATDRISIIIENRHVIDCCRSIAHEMVHERQKYQNRLGQPVPEIGGEIEDEANAVAGQIVKEFIKKELSPEQKKFLGLGTYR